MVAFKDTENTFARKNTYLKNLRDFSESLNTLCFNSL